MTLGKNGNHQGRQNKRIIPFHLLPICGSRLSIREHSKLWERIEGRNEQPLSWKHLRWSKISTTTKPQKGKSKSISLLPPSIWIAPPWPDAYSSFTTHATPTSSQSPQSHWPPLLWIPQKIWFTPYSLTLFESHVLVCLAPTTLHTLAVCMTDRSNQKLHYFESPFKFST